ncbi:transposase [Clostridium sp.]|uniref:transposase n=1 Tax=Clostridium sp. TaxID=1506 RepID=UPI003D6CC7BE
MSRKNIVIYEGAVYHIYQRGNNKEFIFEDDNIKTFILKYLKEYNKKFDYELLAYVIMDNHYHFLIKTNKTDISTIMFFINNLLGKYVNTKLGRTGHAFDSRYRCKLVETDAYLIWLLRYIHRNPVKAHICNDINEYRWSSHYFYNHYIKSHVNIDFILNMLGNCKKLSHEKYFKLVSTIGHTSDNDKDYEIIKQELNMEEAFFLNNNNNDNCNIAKPKRTTLDEIIVNLNIDENMLLSIRNVNRKPCLTSVKLVIIKSALEQCYSLKEIADFLNAAPSTISKLISRNKII